MKLKFMIFFCVLTVTVMAQSGEENKTIFDGNGLNTGYFVNPSVQIGKIAGSSEIIPGFGIGVILNNKVSMSLLYKMTISENTPPEELSELYLHNQFVGLKLEYALKPKDKIHINFPVELGVGNAELDLKDDFENTHMTAPPEDYSFFYFEPGIGVQFNLLEYIKMDFGVAYRLVSNMSFRTITSGDLQGLNISAGLKIGLF